MTSEQIVPIDNKPEKVYYCTRWGRVFDYMLKEYYYQSLVGNTKWSEDDLVPETKASTPEQAHALWEEWNKTNNLRKHKL